VTNISTSNLPSGITNAVLASQLSSFNAMDPTVNHTYFNDFDTFEAGDWTSTATGSPTNGVIAGDGGLLSLINTASNGDLNSLQLKAATFALVAGNKWWFKARFDISNATNAAIILGLIQTTATPLTVTDGVYFSKAAASTQLTAKVAKSSTISTLNVATLANTTYLNVGMHYDGGSSGNIVVYLNNVQIGVIPVTNMPTANLNLTLAVSNGTAAANTLNVDYIFVSTERPSTNL
jgi:hypothetical protein